jgi:hypothetical protein
VLTKKRFATLVLLLLCGLFLAGEVLALNGVAIQRSVIAGGGEPVTDGSLYRLNATIGEPIAGPLALATGYGLRSGFWWVPEYQVFLPLVLRD